MNAHELDTLLCQALCAEVRVREVSLGLWRVDTPLTYPDGDAHVFYLRHLPDNTLRLSDMGVTFMRLSYESDMEKFREGTRERLLQQILAETDLREDDGEFYLESTADRLGRDVLRLGQALTRVHDLSFLNRARAESTFYDDLRDTLRALVGEDRLHERHIVENVPNARDYPVDYFIDGGALPLYLFGVPNRDKARLATIVLQHLIGAGAEFNSMIIFQNMADLPRVDVSRLTNAANDQVDSLDAKDDIRRKLLRRVASA